MPHYCGSPTASLRNRSERSGFVTKLQPFPCRNSFMKFTKASTAFMVTAL
jgi:hypothetical protein